MTRVPDENALSISVVIPLFNGRPHIARALESVFAQTRRPDEIIIVDDGSADDGADRARELQAPVPLRIYVQPNAGQSAARNRGAALARGDWIAFLDQDDMWRPHHLENLHRAASELTAASATAPPGWAYADVDLVDAEDRMIQPSLLHSRPGRHPKAGLDDCIRHDMFILPSASMVSRHAFDTVGGFDVALKGYEDDDLFFRLMRARFAHRFVDEPSVMYRFHDAASSRTTAMVQSLVIYAEKLFAEFAKAPGANPPRAREVASHRFRRTLVAAHARAVVSSDTELLQAVSAAAARLRPHFSERAYWTMRGLMRVLSHTTPARAGLRIGRWLGRAPGKARQEAAGHGLTPEAGLASSSGERNQR